MTHRSIPPSGPGRRPTPRPWAGARAGSPGRGRARPGRRGRPGARRRRPPSRSGSTPATNRSWLAGSATTGNPVARASAATSAGVRRVPGVRRAAHDAGRAAPPGTPGQRRRASGRAVHRTANACRHPAPISSVHLGPQAAPSPSSWPVPGSSGFRARAFRWTGPGGAPGQEHRLGRQPLDRRGASAGSGPGCPARSELPGVPAVQLGLVDGLGRGRVLELQAAIGRQDQERVAASAASTTAGK
jgi:hypothetical protein